MQTLLRSRERWVEVVEACYAPPKDWQSWSDQVVALLRPLLSSCEVGVNLVTIGSTGTAESQPFASFGWGLGLPPQPSHEIVAVIRSMDRETVRAFYYPSGLFASLRDCVRRCSADGRRAFAGIFEQLLELEGRAVLLHPLPNVALALFLLSKGRIELRPHERQTLVHFGLHLESAVRLHLRPESLVAVVAPNGRIDYQRDIHDASKAFEAQAARLRVAQQRGDTEGLALWHALLAGELSVTQRRIGSRRYTFFLENPPQRQPLRALSKAEEDVLAMVCRGRPAKSVAYALGIAESTVSMRLQSAAAKVGSLSRLELVRLAAMLVRDPRASADDAALTASEREVLELLAEGLSNRDIALRRSRSVRTIANQVATLLQKTGASNRKALVAASAVHAVR